jgi:hypothetical protein
MIPATRLGIEVEVLVDGRWWPGTLEHGAGTATVGRAGNAFTDSPQRLARSSRRVRKVSYAKVAESQARGLVHLHAPNGSGPVSTTAMNLDDPQESSASVSLFTSGF